MAEYIFSLNGVSKVVHPNKEILKKTHLSFLDGAKIGILGLNGAGKSTLLRIIAGVDKDILGEITYRKGIKIGYLPQEPELDSSKTVKDIVEEGVADIRAYLDEFNAISARFMEPLSDEEMSTLLEKQGELQNQIEKMGAWELDRKLEMAADALRLPPFESHIAHLSGGEKRRVALCRLLLSTPDLLLLDEPTNHLDAESVAWLEQYLAQFKGTVVAITHDRYFLDNVAGWILELDRGQGIPYEGNYSAWLDQKSQRLAMEEKQESARQKTLKTELDWVRTNPKGRHAKNKARLHRFEELNSRDFQKRNETAELYIPPGPRLGDKVIQVEGLSKAFSQRMLFDNLSFTVPKGAIVGIIGPNGVGKTTLFKLLTGQETPDKGQVQLGETVQVASVDQFRDHLDDNKTVWEEISDAQDNILVGQFSMPSRAYVGRFNFKGADQQKHIGNLSGGERNRVHLAKLLKSGGNVLLLDEPTNDLDVETLQALENALATFPGSALIISHDRWFLDRIATHILAFEDSGDIRFFDGNYTEYEADRKARLGEAALQPHRVKYRQIDISV